MTNEKKSMIFLDASNLMGGWWTYCKQNESPNRSKLRGI
jgi:hypothetical protein